MSTIRPFIPETDYPTLVSWWVRHKAVPLPIEILPQGWVISSGGLDIAMQFLLLDVGGKFAVIEFLTTNPSVCFSRHLVDDVKALVAHIEGVAIKQGCNGMMSFIAPDSGEERMMKRLGYYTGEGPCHRIYMKPLKKEGT